MIWSKFQGIEIAMLNFNEGKACDAIIRRLEKSADATRTDVRFPEQERHAFPVEVAFKIGEQLVALEHTGIEPFGGHVEMEAKFAKLYKPMEEALKDAFGKAAMYELIIPINAFQGKKMAEVKAIQKTIINWAQLTAPTVPKLVSKNYKGTSVGPVTVAGVPFALSLHRFEPPVIPGLHFQIRHSVTNGEELRKERIQDAIEKKFPKLAGWKRDHKAKTVLVLEQNDIQLTAPDLVADAYVPLAKARGDRPDETYLVITCMTPWFVWPILLGDKSYLELVRSSEAEFEGIDPNELFSLTQTKPSSLPDAGKNSYNAIVHAPDPAPPRHMFRFHLGEIVTSAKGRLLINTLDSNSHDPNGWGPGRGWEILPDHVARYYRAGQT